MSNHSAWNIAKYFFCISLERNTARWDACIKEFTKVGIDYVERIVTQESEENRWLSFNDAQYEMIRRGVSTGENFAAFEDDLAFDGNWIRIEEATKQLPADWDALFIGANIIGTDTVVWDMPTRVSANLFRLHNSWQTHSIIYSAKFAKWVLENFDPKQFPVYDEWLRVVAMPVKNIYLMSPMCCYQRPAWSDLWQKDVDYQGAHLQGNNYLKMQ